MADIKQRLLSYEHGGNIYRLCRMLGVAEEDIIDFSASVNPLGVPESVVSAIGESIKTVVHYPDPEMKKLREVIGEHLGVCPSQVICGNGSTELIYLVVRTLRPEKVLIPQPTFSEYERAVLLQKGQNKKGITYVLLRQDKDFDLDIEEFIKTMRGHQMAFLCNPNNPTGRLLSKNTLREIADEAKRQGCYLVVDEAFIDFLPDGSVSEETKTNKYLIVLRSLTKFYALAGLRFGYGVFHPELTEAVFSYKEPWTVNTLAQVAALAALRDEGYRQKSLKLIASEKKFMESAFKELGITFVPSKVNFYLLRLKEALRVIEHLARRNILVRNCSNFIGLDENYIRVAVRRRQDNERLIKELKASLSE
jgi:threonine-phosphate decarboxylase